MGTLKRLLKNELMGVLNVNNMLDTRKGKIRNPVVIAAGLTVVAAFMAAISGMYSFMLAEGLRQLGAIDMLPIVIFVVGSLFMFFYGALQSGSMLFVSKDYDLLLSLPIPSRTLILAKLMTLYISDLCFALIFMLPCVGVWQYYAHPTALSVVLTLLCLPLLPIIPIILATIVGTIITYLSARSRHKTLVGVLATAGLFAAILYVTQLMQSSAVTITDISSYMLVFKEQLLGTYPPAGLFFEATQGSFTNFLILLAVSLAVTAAFTLVVAKLFKSIHSKLGGVTMKVSKAAVKYSTSAYFSAMVKKEARRFFASTIYVINSGMGSAMGVCAVIYVVFFGKEYVKLIVNTPDLYIMFAALMPLVASAFSSISCTTSSSISMEGQSLWVTKQLPVSAYSVFMAKITLNLMLTIPVSVLIGVTGIVLLKLNGLSGVMSIVFPVIMCIFVAYMGLMLNLMYPNFTWTSESKVIKQSASTGIAIFGAMAMIMVTFVLVNVSIASGRANLMYIAVGAIMLAAVLAADRHLRKNGQRILIGLGR